MDVRLEVFELLEAHSRKILDAFQQMSADGDSDNTMLGIMDFFERLRKLNEETAGEIVDVGLFLDIAVREDNSGKL